MAADLVFSNHGLRHSGGIERYLLTLVDALHARGVRPTVVAHRFDRRLPEFGWVDAVEINTLGLGGALRDLWFDRQLRRRKRERGWYPLVALSQTSCADIAISGGTHPGFLAAMERTASWKDRLASLGSATSPTPRWSSPIRLMAQQFGSSTASPRARLRCSIRRSTQRFRPVDAVRRAPPTPRAACGPRRLPAASRPATRARLDLPSRRSAPTRRCASSSPADPQACRAEPHELGFRTDMEDVYRAVDCP
jgi:hypothetical protein